MKRFVAIRLLYLGLCVLVYNGLYPLLMIPFSPCYIRVGEIAYQSTFRYAPLYTERVGDQTVWFAGPHWMNCVFYPMDLLWGFLQPVPKQKLTNRALMEQGGNGVHRASKIGEHSHPQTAPAVPQGHVTNDSISNGPHELERNTTRSRVHPLPNLQ